LPLKNIENIVIISRETKKYHTLDISLTFLFKIIFIIDDDLKSISSGRSVNSDINNKNTITTINTINTLNDINFQDKDIDGGLIFGTDSMELGMNFINVLMYLKNMNFN